MRKSIKPFLGSVLLLCFLACGRYEEPPMSESKLQAVLSDIHIAEAYGNLSARLPDGRSAPKNVDSMARYYKMIFAKHKISATEFDSAMSWYSRHTERLDSVYARMIVHFDSLSSTKK